MIRAFADKPNLRTASRLPTLAGEARVSWAELVCLLACGGLAILAVGVFQQLRISVPGHAILRGVLPMAMGLALVPRRSAGLVMAIGAGLTAAAMSWGSFGRFPPAAVLSILVTGPVLDVALAGRAQGWRLYVRFAVAGAVANLLAFTLRIVTSLVGWELSGSRQFMSFWSSALVSFVLCGALAGLVSAAVCFRLRGDDDLRRN